MQSVNTTVAVLTWVDVITWVFLIANTGRLLAYIPQFICAWRCEYGAKSISILTWSYFTFAHCTALVYALLVLKDSKSVWIFAGNLGVTLCLVTLLLWKRWTHQAKTQAQSAHCPDDVCLGSYEYHSIKADAA